MIAEKTLTFRTIGGRDHRCRVRNGQATVGRVAAALAMREGLAGTYEVLNREERTLDPEMKLDDLPDGEVLTVSSELTPA